MNQGPRAGRVPWATLLAVAATGVASVFFFALGREGGSTEPAPAAVVSPTPAPGNGFGGRPPKPTGDPRTPQAEPSTITVGGVTFTAPPLGADNSLTGAEARYCLRQEIRRDTLAALVEELNRSLLAETAEFFGADADLTAGEPVLGAVERLTATLEEQTQRLTAASAVYAETMNDHAGRCLGPPITDAERARAEAEITPVRERLVRGVTEDVETRVRELVQAQP